MSYKPTEKHKWATVEFARQWNKEIKIRDKSPHYQERVRQAFAKENQADEEEMKLRDAFFKDWTWVEKDKCYVVNNVLDFDGQINDQ